MSSAQLVLQTNFGGFLILAEGYAAESPYLIKPVSGHKVSSNGMWTNSMSLFNPFSKTFCGGGNYLDIHFFRMYTSLSSESVAVLIV